jgi:hypothetical protein
MGSVQVSLPARHVFLDLTLCSSGQVDICPRQHQCSEALMDERDLWWCPPRPRLLNVVPPDNPDLCTHLLPHALLHCAYNGERATVQSALYLCATAPREQYCPMLPEGPNPEGGHREYSLRRPWLTGFI